MKRLEKCDELKVKNDFNLFSDVPQQSNDSYDQVSIPLNIYVTAEAE